MSHAAKLIQASGGGVALDQVTDIATSSTDNLVVNGRNPNGVFISDNGTRLYTSNQTGIVEEFTLSTANDLTSASFSASKDIESSLDDGRLRGITVDTSGTKLFIADFGTEDVTEYSMSSFNLSTLNTTPVRQVNLASLSGASGIGDTEAMIFSRDGTKLYHLSEATGLISQFSMSSAFDITTLSYDSKTLSFTVGGARGCAITTNGAQFYISLDSDDLEEYSLSTPFDISTASATGTTYSLIELEVNAKLNFSNDMTKLFASHYSNDAVYEFDVTFG